MYQPLIEIYQLLFDSDRLTFFISDNIKFKMPRYHKRTPGSRRYLDFNEDNLQAGIKAVQEGMSRREAEQEFGIPRTTLGRRLKGQSSTPGRPPVLTMVEENVIVDRIQLMCGWGFPLDGTDLRYLVKCYLDRKGVNERRFKNNLPTVEFVYHFKKRHSELTERFAGNIKRSRAKVSVERINEYFDNLSQELEGITADCIYNYDETNLSDDPGRKKCLMKRGTKYPERIMNNSKACTSIMFCGSATGEVLPVYVVYKALNVYKGWTDGGPSHARYSCTKSGWFDGDTFGDWFKKVFIPIAKNKEQSVLIGDNLSSHFSSEVLQLCERHNVKFICLPPNSTDKTQPLDVAFFRPLKIKWRQILNEWKTSHPKEATVPKTVFTTLLKQLVEELNKENLVNGFKKCGIYPLDRNQVLSRLPSEVDPREASQRVDSCLIDILKSASGRDGAAPKRGTKVNFAPGKAISVSAEGDDDTEESDESDSKIFSDSSGSEDGCMETDNAGEENISPQANHSKAPLKGSLKVSDWVVVKYDTSTSSKSKHSNQYFAGEIIEVVSNVVLKVSFVRPQYSSRCTQYKWPNYDDIENCDFENILEVLPNPTMTRRGAICF